VEENKNFSSPVACPGEEEGETVPFKNDTVLFFFFVFFLMHETTSFSLKHVVSFKWKLAPKCVSPSICAVFSLVLGFGFLQSNL
jgi:hypothetical protein